MEAPPTYNRSMLTRVITFSWLSKVSIIETVSFLFVILFLYTGTSKLMDFEVFKEQLSDSPILAPLASVVAWLLPFVEFIVSIILFIPKYRLIGLYASFILMILFTGYVGVLLSFSNKLPCSCGGILSLLSWKAHLVLNIFLIVLALLGIRLLMKSKRHIKYRRQTQVKLI